MRKVHLVDGTFELFRCFHGAPRHRNARGEEVGAVRGLLHTLLSLLKSDDVSHLAVAFDALPSARGGASDEPGTLIRRQAPLALEAVTGARHPPLADGAFPSRRRPRHWRESVARQRRGRPSGAPARRIPTSSSAFAGSKVAGVLDRIRRKTTDEATFRSRYGIAPWQLPDYLALVGAPAKGLPGVPGWGPKTAAMMLSHYDSVDQLPVDADDWPPLPRRTPLAAMLAAHRDEALMVGPASPIARRPAAGLPAREAALARGWMTIVSRVVVARAGGPRSMGANRALA